MQVDLTRPTGLDARATVAELAAETRLPAEQVLELLRAREARGELRRLDEAGIEIWARV